MKKAFWAHAISRIEGQEQKEQNGIHLLWTAPAQAGYSIDGFDIERREARGEPQMDCYELASWELTSLHRDWFVSVQNATVYLREGRTPQLPSTVPDEPFDHQAAALTEAHDPNPPGWQTSPGIVNALGGTGQTCSVYDIDLEGSFDATILVVRASWALAIAFREGKAIAADYKFASPSDLQTFEFNARGIDRMVAYVPELTDYLRFCQEVQSPEADESGWSLIARNIQMPFMTINDDVQSSIDELALASSRLLPGESLDSNHFQQLSGVINEAAASPDSRPPRYTSRHEREKISDPPLEITTWPFVTTLLVEPSWRRALGFGFLDPEDGLPGFTALQHGHSYDYRITGRFRRQDLEERFLGFHNVPSGTTLPRAFHLDDVYVTSSRNLKPQMVPAPSPLTLTHAGRKGVTLDGELTLYFSKPITQIALELEPNANHHLAYQAKPTVWLPGINDDGLQDDIPAEPRADLIFHWPIDHLILQGNGVLYGIRMIDDPSTGNPHDVVSASVILRQVPFVPTSAPESPPVLGTENLQRALVPGSGQDTIDNPPHAMGFRLSWLPPALTSIGTLPWPEDLEAAPPFDVASFEVERRRVDTNEPFQPLDPPEPGGPDNTRIGAHRTSRSEPQVLSYGIDLLQVFPDSIEPTPPVPVWMQVDDVLNSLAHRDGPPPGSFHQYRIWSIDPLGRRSELPTVGSEVRLEKRLAPPQPTAPPEPAAPPADDPPPAAPLGVRARVLLAGDPDLSPEDLNLLGTSLDAIVLEWGWQESQQNQDPFAREFRVYYQPNPPDQIRGRFFGAPWRLFNNRFRFEAILSTSVAANALAGRWIKAGAASFKILSHNAGTFVTFFLQVLENHPDLQPEVVDFVLQAPLDGSELRPQAWAERVDVVPMTTNEGYQVILRDQLGVGSDNPRVRAWVGVSAADDQSYIDDEIPDSQLNGGRPGNESSIIAVVVSARYTERPAFSPPASVADVPEEVLSEPLEDTVTAAIDLSTWFGPSLEIPPGHRVKVERMTLAEIVQRISAQSDDQIGADLPTGQTSYTLNMADQEELLAAIRTGEPAQVPTKYLMDFLIRFDTELNELWSAVTPQPVDVSDIDNIRDTLPSKPERYAYRVRIADASGRLSQEAALVPRIVRIPSLRVPAAPNLRLARIDGADVTLRLTIGDVFDVSDLLLFYTDRDEFDTSDDAMLQQRPRLLRLPNRRDLYPKLRLTDGTLLSPEAPIDLDSGVVDQRRRTVDTTISVGNDRRAYFWAIAVTRDGIPSALTGPVIAVTDPALPVVPALTVMAANGVDQASWSWTPIPGLVDGVSIERSLDAGDTWQRISPWLPEGDESFEIVRPPSAPRLYRLVMRGRKGQRFGAATNPTPSAP